MRSFLVLSCSALVLFVGGSTWLAFYPPLPTDLAGVENLDARARHVRIPLADGDALDGWYLPPRNGAMVLLLHGYGRDHTHTWRYGSFLRGAGYGLLAFDFRSSRSGSRLPTTLGHYELVDARAALGWLRTQPSARNARIGLLGESLGGSVALLLGAERPEVRALVVDCAFASGGEALGDACQRWAHLPRWPSAALCRAVGRAITGYDPGALDAVGAATALRDRPILFIHSLNDNRLSPAHPRELWRAAGGKDPLWMIADAGHNQGWVIHRELYEARVLAFLDHHLRGRGAGLPAGTL
jgi:pimeloyl-ACP methyl ester carboxylesterase